MGFLRCGPKLQKYHKFNLGVVTLALTRRLVASVDLGGGVSVRAVPGGAGVCAAGRRVCQRAMSLLGRDDSTERNVR